VVVLTGGIASGKSAVSDRFARLGVPIVDTDVIARELVQPGQAALTAIANSFGGDILDEKGQLNRRRMREIIFSDPASKHRLESILHPAIGAEVKRRLSSLDAVYCLLVVPLLAESGRYQWADRVLVVDAARQTQLTRVLARDQVSREQAEAILNAQSGRQQRLELADDVIENNGSLQDLDRMVSALHEKYQALVSTNSYTSLP